MAWAIRGEYRHDSTRSGNTDSVSGDLQLPLLGQSCDNSFEILFVGDRAGIVADARQSVRGKVTAGSGESEMTA